MKLPPPVVGRLSPLRYKKRLWREAGRKQPESWSLGPWGSRRRKDLLEVLDRINPTIAELTQAIAEEAEKCPQARRLMTHPGVGALTAVAFVLIIGQAHQFDCGKQIAAYLGLVPEEDSSGERRRLGHISKQVTACSVSCWWKRRRQRGAAISDGATNFSTWRSDAGARLRK